MNLKDTSIRNLVSEGKLTVSVIGRKKYYLRKDVENLFKNNIIIKAKAA